MILWLYLGPQSVCTVGWVGLDLGILEVFSNLCDSVVLFRATISGHSGMGRVEFWDLGGLFQPSGGQNSLIMFGTAFPLPGVSSLLLSNPI